MGAISVKNRSIKNLLWGIGGQVITIAFGVLVPRLVLVSYGSEVNGLLNSVIQIFSYFTLLEAGIGTVALQALYKSVGEGDYKTTNSILSAVNKYYRRIGILYAFAVVALSFIYPFVVASSIPFYTIVLVIIFNGVSPVSNFLFQGKYTLLIQAEGKIYILNAINTTINILTSIGKIVLLTFGFDVVSVQFSVALISLLQMMYIAFYVKKNYQWIDLRVEPFVRALSQSKNALVHHVTWLLCTSTDVALLTLFAGLKNVSVYAMYMLLFGMIRTFMASVNSSVLFILGQKFNTDREAFLRIESIYETLYLGAVFLFYTIAAIFVTPFMRLYTAGVDDINYEMDYLPVLFLILNIFTYIRTPGQQVVTFAGHFQKTQNRAIVEALIHFGASFVMVRHYGIYGVLFGAIIALGYRVNETFFYVSHRILHVSVRPIYLKCMAYSFVSAAIFILTSYITLDLSTYTHIILWAGVYTFVALLFYVGVASLIDCEAFNFFKSLLRKMRNQFS